MRWVRLARLSPVKNKSPSVRRWRFCVRSVAKERLKALHEHLGFSRAVLVQASCHGRDNSAMVDAMEWSKGAWRGVATVDASVSDQELERLNTAGARGFARARQRTRLTRPHERATATSDHAVAAA
jgi:predicted TIM-barrel fold metal-dependent hydrolase